MDRRQRFTDPDGCRDVEIPSHKAGSMSQRKHLDAAIRGEAQTARFANDAAGFGELAAWLAERGVCRIGMEATGGYETNVCAFLAASSFELVLHQPLEVRLFARLTRQRAKNDRCDARLIAAATAQMKTYREHTRLSDLRTDLEAHIRILAAPKKGLATGLVRPIRERADLARRLDLLASLPGVGAINAAAMLIRMPERGAMDHGQALSASPRSTATGARGKASASSAADAPARGQCFTWPPSPQGVSIQGSRPLPTAWPRAENRQRSSSSPSCANSSRPKPRPQKGNTLYLINKSLIHMVAPCSAPGGSRSPRRRGIASTSLENCRGEKGLRRGRDGRWTSSSDERPQTLRRAGSRAIARKTDGAFRQYSALN